MVIMLSGPTFPPFGFCNTPLETQAEGASWEIVLNNFYIKNHTSKFQ